MKDIKIFTRVGLFNMNPVIEVYKNNTCIENKKSTVQNLAKDIFSLSVKYDKQVSGVHLFGAKNFLSKVYTELTSNFALNDIQIFVNEEREI